jgi:hypothetical protein
MELYPLDDDDSKLTKAYGKEQPLMSVWSGNPILTVGDLLD